MAYAVTNNQNSLSFISKDSQQLGLQCPNHASLESTNSGKVLEITEDQFISLQKGIKQFTYDGSTITLVDNTFTFPQNEQALIDVINFHKECIDNALIKHKNDAFGIDLNNFKTVLENIDTSSITYPMTKSLMQHCLDNDNDIISVLQMI